MVEDINIFITKKTRFSLIFLKLQWIILIVYINTTLKLKKNMNIF